MVIGDLPRLGGGIRPVSEIIEKMKEGGVAANGGAKTEFCPKCDYPMREEDGKYGKFLRCVRFPFCKETKSLPPPQQMEIEACQEELVGKTCPKCQKGKLKERTNGKTKEPFLACDHYPKCKFTMPKTKKKISQKNFWGICPSCWAPLRFYFKDSEGVIWVRCSESKCCYGRPRGKKIQFEKGKNDRCPKCGKDLLVKTYTSPKGVKTTVFVCENLGECFFLSWIPGTLNSGDGHGSTPNFSGEISFENDIFEDQRE